MPLQPDPYGPLGEPRPREMPWQVSHVVSRALSDADSTPGLNPTVRIQKLEVNGQTLDAANQSGYGRGRLTGPVAVLKSLASRWRLDDEQVSTLLALGPHQSATELRHGTLSLYGKDQRHRAGYLITIYGLLNSVFRDPEVGYAWLTEKKEALGGDSPLERMLKGTMEDIITTKQLVETLAGQ